MSKGGGGRFASFALAIGVHEAPAGAESGARWFLGKVGAEADAEADGVADE